jgi:hypothetical protein
LVLKHRKRWDVLPDLKLENVWEAYTKEPSSRSDENHRIAYERLQYLDVETREGILSDLLQIETDSTRQKDRLRYIRKKIMGLVDIRNSARNSQQIVEHGGNREYDRADDLTEKKRERTITVCDLEIAILRAYTRGKYGDGRKNDWYEMYTYLSETFYSRMSTAQTGVSVPRFIFEGKTMKTTEENFQICRKKCIDAYVGQEFDIPTNNSNRLLKLWRKIRRKPVWRKLIS